ncbi:MAG: MarR family transcriptional regulator [Brevundimonas sp.]
MTTPPSPARPGGPLDDLLCFSVYTAGLAFNRVYKPLLDRYGITYPQYLALVALNSEEGQTVGELGEKLFLESNTMTPLLKRLENGGLLSRKRDGQDERVVRVTLTDAGRALAQEAQTCLTDEIGTAIGLDAAARARLTDQISALADTLRRAA